MPSIISMGLNWQDVFNKALRGQVLLPISGDFAFQHINHNSNTFNLWSRALIFRMFIEVAAQTTYATTMLHTATLCSKSNGSWAWVFLFLGTNGKFGVFFQTAGKETLFRFSLPCPPHPAKLCHGEQFMWWAGMHHCVSLNSCQSAVKETQQAAAFFNKTLLQVLQPLPP